MDRVAQHDYAVVMEAVVVRTDDGWVVCCHHFPQGYRCPVQVVPLRGSDTRATSQAKASGRLTDVVHKDRKISDTRDTGTSARTWLHDGLGSWGDRECPVGKGQGIPGDNGREDVVDHYRGLGC